MAEDKVEPRELNWRQLLPWTVIFQGFRVALDLNKLLLAAAGILLTAVAWWLLSVIFYYQKPEWPSKYMAEKENKAAAWAAFKQDREQWNLIHETAGPADSNETLDAADLASSETEYNQIRAEAAQVKKDLESGKTVDQILQESREGKRTVTLEEGNQSVKVPEHVTATALQLVQTPPHRPAGRMRTWPWFEPRGPNPYLLVTGRAGQRMPDGTTRWVPWEAGHLIDWFVGTEVPVLLEPLVKLLSPVIYFFSPHAGLLARLYFLLALIAGVAIWALFGGAITRIAAVQWARQEKIGAREALVFAYRRYVSFLSAPLFPLVLVAVIVVLMILFGAVQMIPIFGDIVIAGLLWWLMLLAAIGMAVVLVGLVGWPLMSATISAEGTDSWEAVSRSYSYVFGAPWHYLWYGVIALVYGAIVVFFVGFMGSATVYLAKWGVNQTPFIQSAHREPSFLFVYAPSSFGWRNLLLQGAVVDGQNVVERGVINRTAYEKWLGLAREGQEKYEGKDKLTWWNKVGAFLVAIWLYLFFLLILGFGYSYFWSASTIIYLLMRRKVDDTELDEVYLEEEDHESSYGTPAFSPAKSPAPAAAPATSSNVTMVEPPALRTPASAPTVPADQGGAPVSAPPTPQADGGVGNSPAGGSPS
jgi:hypothetical protein